MTRNLRLSALCLLPLVVFGSGCLPITMNAYDSTSKAQITVFPAAPLLGEEIEVSFEPNKELLRLYDGVQWTASGPQAGVTWQCRQAMTSPKMNCMMPVGGPWSIQMDLTSSTGRKKLRLNKQITIAGGGSDSNPILMILELKRQQSDPAFAVRATNQALNSGTSRVVEDDSTFFDFSRTDRSDLQYLVDFGTGSFQNVEPRTTYAFSDPGDYIIRAQARTPQGTTVAALLFTLSVSCRNSNLAVDANKIHLEPIGVDGQFRVWFDPGLVTGGQGNHQIRLDVNADGVVDYDWRSISSLTFFTVDAGHPALTNFANRGFQVQARDTVCYFQAAATKPYPFPIRRSDGNPANDQQSQRPGYNFFEALIGGSNPQDPKTNLDYNVGVGGSTPAAPLGPTFDCRFNLENNAASISSNLRYPYTTADSTGLPANSHGFTKFDFTVNGFTLAEEKTYHTVASVNYMTAFQPDSPSTRRNYARTDCPVQVKVKMSQDAIGGCTRQGGSGSQEVLVHTALVGTFNCANVPAKEDPTSKINLTLGAFSCYSGSGKSTVPCEAPPAVCGDGNVDDDAGEQCDAGTQNGNGVCGIDCRYVAPVCGDGHLQHGEQCDTSAGSVGCGANCRWIPVCGNDRVEDGEQCDDGSGNGGPGVPCSNQCQIVVLCGNGIVDPGEACDLGNQNGQPGQKCSTSCENVALCGDGILDQGEQCDLGTGNGTPGSGCSNTCHSLSVCGNGTVEAGEECDEGSQNGQGTCDPMCKRVPM